MENWESLDFGTNIGILLAYLPTFCRDVEYYGNMSGFFVCSAGRHDFQIDLGLDLLSYRIGLG